MVDYSGYEHLLVEVRDGVALLTMNRPEVLNATNFKLHNELSRIWLDLGQDPDVRVALVTGSGRNIGRATVLQLARMGADVVVNARTNRGEAEAVAQEARELGVRAVAAVADVADQEIELLAFDCFRINPHYHYGPRYKNERIFIDTTLVADSLGWVLAQFQDGNLPAMIERAGYPTIAAGLDRPLVAAKVLEVESTPQAMAQADPR